MCISEFGFRIYYYFKYGRLFSSAEQHQRYIDRLETINLKISSYEKGEGDIEKNVLHPYVGFVPFSNLETSLKKQNEDFVILLLGGSVAAGVGDVADVMIDCLKSDESFINKNIKFINCTRGGYKQPQQLMILAFLLSIGADLDFVINIDGFNEILLSNENMHVGIHIAYPSYMHWAHLVNPEGKSNPLALEQIYLMNRCTTSELLLLQKVSRCRLYKSCVISYIADLYQKRLQGLFNTYQVRYARYLIKEEEVSLSRVIRGPRYDSQPSMRSIVDIWKRSSLLIHNLCLGCNVPYIHILQPTLWDVGSKPLTEEEKAIGAVYDSNGLWRIGVQKGYPLLRAAGEELREANLRFFDFSMIFKDTSESLYLDLCHYNFKFRKIIARKIAEIIIGELNP